MHNPHSVNQVGTLKYFREKYNRHNATPKKVLDSYEGSEELFLSMGRAYIVEAALKYFGMKQLTDKPTVHVFQKNIVHKSVVRNSSILMKQLVDLLTPLSYKNSLALHVTVKIT